MLEILISSIILLVILIITAFYNLPILAIPVVAAFTGGGLSPLQKKVASGYKKYKLPKKRATFQEFCFPKKWSVQPQQEFVAEYMRPSVGKQDKTILVDHLIGAGKTCLIIKTAGKWINRDAKPLILLPASLIPGFYDELDGFCGEGISRDDINVMSYNQFLISKRVKASIIIIDEAQNIANESGEFYKAIQSFIDSHSIPVVLLSGTPIFDNPNDLIPLAKLLRIDVPETITPGDISRLFAGKVSFFAGAPSYTFPKTYINIVLCEMSKFQTRWYTSEVEAEKSKRGNIILSNVANNFYIKSRQRANIVYPRGLINGKVSKAMFDNIGTYSAKFQKLLKKLKKGYLSFVYTDFTGQYGISALIGCLQHMGYRDYLEDGAGKRRYVVWSGEQTLKEKGVIRNVFNNVDNDNASQIQIVIGSPAIKEGVSLLRMSEVHILSPYWNWSRLQQIYGRAARFCSHKSLPARYREVEIYIYVAVINGYKPDLINITPDESIDAYMLDIADKKKKENEPYLEALMDVAVDRGLFQAS